MLGQSRRHFALRVICCGLVLVCAVSLANAQQSSTPKKSATSKTSGTHKSSSTHPKATTSTIKAKSPSKTHAASAKHASYRKKPTRVRGQQKIDSERALSIQQALIREHYLRGDATGTWDEASEAAMRRYQEDNGWQDKTVPDSRALIKLGLGPSKDHLLNPESAMTTVPDPPKAQPLPTTSKSAPAVADPVTPAVTSTTPPSSTPASSDPPNPQ